MEEKIIEIEIKLAYQEDLLLSLNEVIVKQQSAIMEITRQFVKVKNQLQTVMDTQSDSSPREDEVPPHY